MKFTRIFIKLGIFGLIAIIISYLGVYFYASVSPDLNIKSRGTYYLYDNNDKIIYQGSSTSKWIDIDTMDNKFLDAVVAIEDKNFYSHNGFDMFRIAKAMMLNLENGEIVQGASTITQQLVKNLYLEFDQTWKRKGKEAFLTIIAEMQYDKDEILEAYLNTINYGQGNYGIGNAASYYFNKSVSNLTIEEALILAAIPKSPNRFNPVTDLDKAKERGKIVARAMLKEGYLTDSEYKNIDFSKINVYGKNEEHNLQMLMYYQDAVLAELNDLGISLEVLEKGGLKIYTNLDMKKQTLLEENILTYMNEEDDLQISSVIINPQTGAVEALTGGMNYAKSEYNRAVQSKRQVGSTMKPFLYYGALENDLVSSTKFRSEFTTFNIDKKYNYSPTNFNDKYANKEITMAAAIAMSDNVYAVKTNLFLGVDTLIDVAKRTGIKEKLQPVASLALGTSEINMLDYAKGYTTLASGGYQKDIFFIKKIEDSNGLVIYEHKEKDKLVLNPNYVFILNELLANTTNSHIKDYTSATALSIASKLSRKYAIKTGTTIGDYWTVGYNPDELMMVWIGYDDNREFTQNYGHLSKNIWADTMESILKAKENRWYETPENVVGVILDGVTGEYTDNDKKAIMYYYLKGTEPTKEQIVSGS